MALFLTWLDARYRVFAEASWRRSRIAKEFLVKHKRIIGYLAVASLATSATFYSLRYLNRRRIERNNLIEEEKQRDALKPSYQFSEFRRGSNASTASSSSVSSTTKSKHDPYSTYLAICTHYDAIFELDFNSHILTASVKYKLEAKKEINEVIFDMKGQKILMCMLDETELSYEVRTSQASETVPMKEQLSVKLPGYASAGTEFEVILKYEFTFPTNRRDFFISDSAVKSTLISQEIDAPVTFDLQLRACNVLASAISFANQITKYKAEGCSIINFQLKKPSRIDRFFLAAGPANHSEIVGHNQNGRIWWEKGVAQQGKRVGEVLGSPVLKNLEQSPLGLLLKQKPFLREFDSAEVTNILVTQHDILHDERSTFAHLSDEDSYDDSIIEEKTYLQCVRALLSSFFSATIQWNNNSNSDTPSFTISRIAEIIVWEMIYDSTTPVEANAFLRLRNRKSEVAGTKTTSSIGLYELLKLKQYHTKKWSLMELIKEFISDLPTAPVSAASHHSFKEIPTTQAFLDFSASKLKAIKKKPAGSELESHSLDFETESQAVLSAIAVLKDTSIDESGKVHIIQALTQRESRCLIRLLQSHGGGIQAINLIQQIKSIRRNP